MSDDLTPLPFPPKKRRLSRGIYLVPSLLTAGALFSGFYAIVYTLRSLLLGRDEFHAAVIAIIVATFLDSMDGRMARLMKAESEFGVQFDSIADMVSFGVAPAVLVYAFSLVHLDKLGWMGAFLYLICAAVRLARFNVISTQVGASRKYFKGLPSPVAAGGTALSLLMMSRVAQGNLLHMVMLIITAILSLLMISNVRFRSFKDLSLGRHRLQVFLYILGICILLVSFQETALFGMFLVYLTWGLVEELVLFRRRRKTDPTVPFLPFGDRGKE